MYFNLLEYTFDPVVVMSVVLDRYVQGDVASDVFCQRAPRNKTVSNLLKMLKEAIRQQI